MSTSNVLSALLDRPLTELVDDLTQVRGRRESAEREEAEARSRRETLAAEEAVLMQLIEWRRGVGDAPNRDSDTGDSNAGQSVTENGAAVTARPRRIFEPGQGRIIHDAFGDDPAAPVSKRDAMRAVMAQHPERDAWRPREMRDRLARAGITATTNNVAVTMRRMAERGQLQRLEDGRYTLPPKPGASDMGVGQGSTPAPDDPGVQTPDLPRRAGDGDARA
jgi:hypothetical protein